MEGFSMRRYGLRDDQYARIEFLLPGSPGHAGRNSKLGNRLFVDAIIWKFRSGRRGAICRNAMARGRTFIPGSRVGLRAAYGRIYSRC